MEEKITNEMKFGWFDSLTFQDMIDCVLKGTIVSIKSAESDMDYGISDRYCKKDIRYRKFNEIKYNRVELTDRTIINPDTLLRDIKKNENSYYRCWINIKISKNDIKKCRSKEEICKRIFNKIKPFLYFKTTGRSYSYCQIVDIISTNENSYKKDYSSLIKEIYQKIRRAEDEIRDLKDQLRNKERYQLIYKQIHEEE